LAGYETLPIAQIQRTGDRGGLPQLDTRYIPPLLAIDAWPPLGRDIVREIYDMVGKKLEVLSQIVTSRGLTLTSQEPGDLDRVFMLAQVNEAYATLGVLSFARGVHPFAAYTELCRIVGKLSIFGPDRRVPEVPQYDHDDLARIFAWVKERIEALLNAIRDDEYEQEYFVGVGLGMLVTLKPKWLNPDWKWYVGVAYENITDQECRELLAPDQLDWKLGSQSQVEMLFKLAKPGLHLVPLDRTPRSLPANRNWDYYEVSRDNAAWKDVQSTQTLAMRLRDALIVNRNDLQGQRKLIVNYRGKRAVLEFALFAVHLQS
jgi:type VI secretion system protein ImpJ